MEAKRLEENTDESEKTTIVRLKNKSYKILPVRKKKEPEYVEIL